MFFAGLGGVFKASGNVLNHHIMPSSYESNGLFTQDQISTCLKYDELIQPVTAVGTMMSDGGIGTYGPDDENLEYVTDVRGATFFKYLCISVDK